MTTAQAALRVVLYARVSGEEQKQGHNIDSQLAELRQFAEQRGWPIVEVYQDEAWSGAALARPSLDRLRDDAGKGRFDAVLINDVDRLARDITHLGVIKRDLERSGVQVIFRKIPSENSPTHNLLVNILGSFAEFERELIMDRTRRGRRHKVETRQQFIGCIPPYGYRYVPQSGGEKNGQLMINPEEATVVRAIYGWIDKEALSVRRVVDRLNSDRIKPRKGGEHWEQSSVLRIVRSPVYSGTWHYNKLQLCYPRALGVEAQARAKKSSTQRRPKEEWIPVELPSSLRIISTEQWRRVQEQINRNRAFSPRNSKHQYLLSGLVRCGGCGSPYVGNPSHGRFQYRCHKRCKRLPLISEHVLDANVWQALETVLKNPPLLMKSIQEIKSPTAPPNDEVAQIQAGLSQLGMEEKRIVEAYRLGILTPEQLAHELELISARRRLMEKQKSELAQDEKATVTSQATVEDYCRQICERFGELTFETKRSVLRLLLKAVIFEGDQIRIMGVLALPRSGSIAVQGTDHCGHNPSERDAATARFALVSRLESSHKGGRRSITR